MGCDIHMITQIKKDNKWEYVPEIPDTLDMRNYSVFAAIAGVRDSFNGCVFEQKGLPEDLGERKYVFQSETPFQKTVYAEKGEIMCVCDDGKILKPYDADIMHTLTEEEYNMLNEYSKANPEKYKERYSHLGKSWSGSIVSYYVFDAFIANGHLEEVPFSKLYPTFEAYMKDKFEDEWDEEVGDYGYWGVDFDCPDYHSPSHLTLKEFLEADYASYTARKYKMSKAFYEEFIKAGGTLPDKFYVEESSTGDIRDCFMEAFDPTITVCWQPDEEERKNMPLFKGIEELKEIAKKYNIDNPEDIRIVFAFDN